MNQKNTALTLYCPDILILILWGNSCNIFLVIGGVSWTQPFEMLKSLRPSLPLTAFQCVGVSGVWTATVRPWTTGCQMFSESSDQQFSKNHCGGGSENLSGGEVGFNKIVFGFLLNRPPTLDAMKLKTRNTYLWDVSQSYKMWPTTRWNMMIYSKMKTKRRNQLNTS